MVRVVETCNEEKVLIEDKFVAVRQILELLATLILMTTGKIECEVSEVGGQMINQQAMINDMHYRISILQKQDHVIVKEASNIVQRIPKEIHNS
jgi:hypothetical protein